LTTPGHLKQTQRARLADAGADSMPFDSVLLKVSERDRQFAIVAPAMAGELNLDAIENAAA
jgi:hypothetical protein